MKEGDNLKDSPPYRLPVLHHGGQSFFIDNRLGEFRTPQLKCISFRSEEGQRLLGACTLLDCPGCFKLVVFAPGLMQQRVTCRCGRRVSLEVALRLERRPAPGDADRLS